ncbi:hypothetical protein Ingeline5_15 [Cellulophaga phage Ingeline_5]|nr:hypothetical protein Ingeline5_15 [Cellulophaga phage Ingeline_5]
MPIVVTNYFLYVEREKKEAAQVKAELYESQAKSTVKTYDNLKASFFVKIKRGERLIMLGTNDYYDYQFTSKLGLEGLDYLGREDEKIHDTISAKDFNVNDFKTINYLDRAWFSEEFIIKEDTQKVASFKFKRIEFNRDTLLYGLVFDLEKLKRELKLKDE